MLFRPGSEAVANADVRELHRVFAKSLIINDNIYALLHSAFVNKVVTLSSSVAVEAKFFGKPSVGLVAADRDNMGPIVSRWYRVSYQQMDRAFWSSLLSNSQIGGSSPVPSFADGALRRRYGYSWGFTQDAVGLADHRVEPGESVAFSDGEKGAGLYGAGWHHQESWGRWSSAETATMFMQISRRYPQVILTLDMMGFIPVEGHSVHVTIRSRGSRRSTPVRVEFRSSEWQTAVLALELESDAGDDNTELVFEISEALSPSLVGSPDRRKLGIRVQKLALENASASFDR